MSKKLTPNQKLFNAVVRQLRKQGKRSVIKVPGESTVACLYRSEDGSRCAVGAVMSNKDYRPLMEESTVYALLVDFPHVLTSLRKRFGDFEKGMLDRLQSMHDSERAFEGWEPRFFTFVQNNPHYGLKIPPLKA